MGMNEVARRQIGGRLRESRQLAQLTQAHVAAQVGVSAQAVSGWEAGDAMPRAESWLKLAPLLGVSLDYLAFGIRTIPVSRYDVMEKVFGRPGVQPAGVVFGTPEDTTSN